MCCWDQGFVEWVIYCMPSHRRFDLTAFGIIMMGVSSTQFDFHYGVHNSLQQVHVALERVPVYGGALA